MGSIKALLIHRVAHTALHYRCHPFGRRGIPNNTMDRAFSPHCVCRDAIPGPMAQAGIIPRRWRWGIRSSAPTAFDFFQGAAFRFGDHGPDEN